MVKYKKHIDSNHNDILAISIIAIITFFYIIITCYYRDLFGMECRNALFAKEMLNHIKFVPTCLNIPYPDYTPVYFWLEVLFAKLLGGLNTIAAVLPSSIGFIGIIFLLYILIKPISTDLALLTSIVFASLPKVWDAAAHATIDILLSFFISATLISLYTGLNKNKQEYYINLKWFMLSIICMIIAFFIKGLIGIVLPLVIWDLFLLLKYRKNSIKSILYFSIICIIVAVLCQSLELFIDYKEYGWAFVKQVISLQVTSRLTERANKGIFYYIGVILNCVFPWLIVVIYLIFNRTKNINIRSKFQYIYNNIQFTYPEYDLLLFGFSWFLGIFIVFELASCKHSRYLYPAMPGLAICLAVIIYKLYNGSYKFVNFLKLTALSVIILPFIPLFLKLKSITLHTSLFLSCIAITLIAWYLINFINNKIRPWFYLSLIIMFLMSSFSLLFGTSYSQKQSGRLFMQCINKNASRLFYKSKIIPVYVYGINRDGNGVKLAYYAAPDLSFQFFFSTQKLLERTKPFILICYQKDKEKLLNILNKKYKTHILCKGLVHMVPTEGFLITMGPKQGKTNEQISTSNITRSSSKCICPNCSKTRDENNW